jgi:hypothetical protein
MQKPFENTNNQPPVTFPKNTHQPLTFTTEDGKPFEVPPDGALGLLALGAVGVDAWRRKRLQVEAQEHLAALTSKNV